MYLINKVRDAIFNQIGWKNTLDTREFTLDPNIFTDPESGVYYNIESSELELSRLRMIAPFQEGWNYSDYSATSTYNIGDIVKDPNDNTIFYESVVDGNTGNPITDPLFWNRRYPFSEWLEEQTKHFINKLIRKVVLAKKLDQTTKSLFVDNNLYPNTGNIKDTTTKQGRFVGYRIIVNNYKNLQMVISKLGFQFTQTQSQLPIYIYHSSQIEPLRIVNIDYTKPLSSQWVSLKNQLNEDDITFNNVDYDNVNGTDSGGYFYIGYYEDDLQGEALRYKYNTRSFCASCNANANNHYKNYSKHAIIQPFSVSGSNLNIDREYWDSSSDMVTTNQNWGINMSFSQRCDITDLLIDNASVMENALLVASRLWVNNEFFSSNRSSTELQKYKQDAVYNLSVEGTNLRQMYEDEVEAINFDFSNLDTPCAPKQQLKKRVRYMTV